MSEIKMKQYSLYNILFALSALLVSACSQEPRASIEGTIANAKGERLILEHLGGGAPTMVDTVTLDEQGHFRFAPVTEPGGPDFFSLRISTQSIPLIIDTLGTPVRIEADLRRFGSDYTVGDATNQRLQEAARQGNELRRRVIDAAGAVSDGRLTQVAYRDSVYSMVRAYKQAMLDQYIYQDPSDPVSYYVLFESVRGLSVFDPYDPADNRAYGAVATGWLYNYAASPRVAALEKVTKEGQVMRRRAIEQAQRNDSLARGIVQQTTFFDLTLPDKRDREVSLSSLVSPEHVVVIDFTAYFLPASVQHNMILSKVYEKYHQRGLTIYQVCLDYDENFWKVSADNVPWTVVHDREVLFDEQGNIQYSRPAATYNVSALPTSYILDRTANLRVRVEDDTRLEEELKKLF